MVELAVIDIGDFKFKSQYHHLVVPESRWFKMTSQQRQHHLSKVSSTPVNKCDNSIDDSAVPLNDLQGNMSLSLSVEEAKIQSLPRAVLDGIWGKAKQLINTSGQIVEGPCSSSSSMKCYVVASKTSDRPHIVQHNNKSGQFCCDSSCPSGSRPKFVHIVLLLLSFPNAWRSFFCGTTSQSQSQILTNFQKWICQKEAVEKGKSHQERRNEVVPHAGAAEHILHKGGPTYMQSCNYVAIAYKITQFSV